MKWRRNASPSRRRNRQARRLRDLNLAPPWRPLSHRPLPLTRPARSGDARRSFVVWGRCIPQDIAVSSFFFHQGLAARRSAVRMTSCVMARPQTHPDRVADALRQVLQRIDPERRLAVYRALDVLGGRGRRGGGGARRAGGVSRRRALGARRRRGVDAGAAVHEGRAARATQRAASAPSSSATSTSSPARHRAPAPPTPSPAAEPRRALEAPIALAAVSDRQAPRRCSGPRSWRKRRAPVSVG